MSTNYTLQYLASRKITVLQEDILTMFAFIIKCVYAIKIVNIKYEVCCGLIICILCSFWANRMRSNNCLVRLLASWVSNCTFHLPPFALSFLWVALHLALCLAAYQVFFGLLARFNCLCVCFSCLSLLVIS